MKKLIFMLLIGANLGLNASESGARFQPYPLGRASRNYANKLENVKAKIKDGTLTLEEAKDVVAGQYVDASQLLMVARENLPNIIEKARNAITSMDPNAKQHAVAALFFVVNGAIPGKDPEDRNNFFEAQRLLQELQ